VTFAKYLNIVKIKTMDKAAIAEIKKGKRKEREDK
jgi:hypothetical protein